MSRAAPRVIGDRTNMADAASVAASKPPLEPRGPIVNDVVGALEDTGCSTERFCALLDSATIDLKELIVEAPALPHHLESRATEIWMIFVLAGEKARELNATVAAIAQRAHDDRRESRS